MTGNIIFIDTETAGLGDSDPTIQIAAIVTRDWQEVESFERKIVFDPKRVFDPEALIEINGFAPDVWAAEALPADEALRDFVGFFEKHKDLELTGKTGGSYKVARVAGHNITGFDIPRINRGVKHFAMFWSAQWWYPLDTYQRAIWHFAELGLEPPANYRLVTLARHFGIDTSGAHDALADCRLSMQLARKFATWEGSQR